MNINVLNLNFFDGPDTPTSDEDKETAAFGTLQAIDSIIRCEVNHKKFGIGIIEPIEILMLTSVDCVEGAR